MKKEIGKALAVTAKELAKPVYKDGVQPATKEVGKSLQTVSGLINVLLMPLALLVHGSKEIEEKLKVGMTEKMKGTKKEDIVAPPLNIVGPLLEKYRYNYDNEALADMFLSLLANSMDKNRTIDAHPAFIDIIGQLSTDEAKLLQNIMRVQICPKIDVAIATKDAGYVMVRKNFLLGQFSSGLQYASNIQTYLDNLKRLNLIEFTSGSMQDQYVDENLYKPLLEDPFITKIEETLNKDTQTLQVFKGVVTTTSFGDMFYRAVTR